jgi:hypothetical protein
VPVLVVLARWIELSSRLGCLESVLNDSGVVAMSEAVIPRPRRQLGVHSVLVGILLSISTAKVAHLASAYRALCELPIADGSDSVSHDPAATDSRSPAIGSSNTALPR